MTGQSIFRNRFLKSFLGVASVRFLALPLGLLSSVLLARMLGPDDYGRYAFIMSLLPILALPVAGGVPQWLTREVAATSHQKDLRTYRGLIRATYQWICLYSLILIPFFWLILWALDLFEANGISPLALAVFLIPFMGINALRAGVLRGFGFPGFAELMNRFLQPLFFVGVVVTLFWFGKVGLNWALAGQLVAWAVAFVAATLVLLKVDPVKGVQVGGPRYRYREWGGALWPFSLIALASTMNLQIGAVLLGLLGTDEAVAALRIADRGGQLAALPLTVINMIIVPRIVGLYRDGKRHSLAVLAQRTARVSVLLALSVVVILMVWGGKLIELVYGVQYAPLVYAPLIIIAVAQIMNAFFGPVANLLSMSGHERHTMRGQMIALIVNVVVCVALIPFLGAIGAALGIALALLTWNLVLAFDVRSRLGFWPAALGQGRRS